MCYCPSRSHLSGMRSLAPRVDACIYLSLGEDQFESAVLNWSVTTCICGQQAGGAGAKVGALAFRRCATMSTSDGSSLVQIEPQLWATCASSVRDHLQQQCLTHYQPCSRIKQPHRHHYCRQCMADYFNQLDLRRQERRNWWRQGHEAEQENPRGAESEDWALISD